jgi:hypothetical protein
MAIIDLFLFRQAPSAGPAYATPPYVVLMVGPDGRAIHEFPAETREAARETVRRLTSEAAASSPRMMMERYGVPSHIVRAVCGPADPGQRRRT